MATIPAAGHISDSLRTEGEVKTDLEAVIASLRQVPGAGQAELAVTISGGVVTPAGSAGTLVIDTEAAAASDDLATVITTNYPDGSILILRNSNAARTVIVKHAATGAGQIFLERSADYYLDDTKNRLAIQRRGADWYEIFRNPPRLAMPGTDKSADFTVTRGDCGKVFVIDGAGVDVSFEPVATLGNGWTCTFINVNSSANSVSLDPNGSETIDRKTTLILSPKKTVTVLCDGTEMFTINGYHQNKLIPQSFTATLIIDALDGEYFEVGALTANITSFTINNLYSGARLRVRFHQDATGGRTVALPSGAKVTGSLASTANQASVLDLTFSFNGNRWEGFWTQIPT